MLAKKTKKHGKLNFSGLWGTHQADRMVNADPMGPVQGPQIPLGPRY